MTDAVLAIAGLTSPSEAWDRLDKVYGNKEVAILSTIRKLRGFKSSKQSDCDQIIELVRAVQRCQTVLEALDAMHKFHGDRETTALIIDCLPTSAQDRWFHQCPRLGETQPKRSASLLEWLEQERQAAVAVHLHNVAKVHSIPPGPVAKPRIESGVTSHLTTDQGLMSGSLHATQSNGAAAGGDRPASIGPVTTAAMADEVTARRLASLTEKKLDCCPLCKVKHFYEKTWVKVVPPKKTRMVSTHLSTCPSFASMSQAEKLRTVTAHGACLHCSAWDHTRHKLQGGGVAGKPKC